MFCCGDIGILSFASISPQRQMIEIWFKNWWTQLIMRNLNLMNNIVSARGAYYGEYGMSRTCQYAFTDNLHLYKYKIAPSYQTQLLQLSQIYIWQSSIDLTKVLMACILHNSLPCSYSTVLIWPNQKSSLPIDLTKLSLTLSCETLKILSS